MVLFWEKGMVFSGKKYVALFQGSEMSEEWYSPNLIWGIDCCRKATLAAPMCPTGQGDRVQQQRAKSVSWEDIT